jgi:hypothetical protein
VTSAEEPLPTRDPTAPTSPSWSLCLRCGAVAADWPIHLRWHDVLEGRVDEVRAAVAALPEQTIKPLDERVTDIETRLDGGV